LKILIAEDEQITLRRLQFFLEKMGHSIITAENGLDAIEKFLSSDVEFVITDWLMPEMDGVEFIKHIRGHAGADKPYVYIILLTSKGNKEDIVKGLSEIGADDYMVKPFDYDELWARINVGQRMLKQEMALREYGQSLEKIVRRQTMVIRRTHEETILRLLTALESRDEETGGHVRRIALFSAVLAEKAGWPIERIDDIQLASPMHDIGKIGVPDNVLRKRGKLDDDEFNIIKSHTTIGGQIFGDTEYPMHIMARDIALYHHERWDGKGYPEGLSGEDIPEAARIVALVDVYDALSHDRVYKKAFPEDKVLSIMKEGRGSHFDHNIYDMFLELLPEFKKISKENP